MVIVEIKFINDGFPVRFDDPQKSSEEIYKLLIEHGVEPHTARSVVEWCAEVCDDILNGCEGLLSCSRIFNLFTIYVCDESIYF